MLRKKVANWIFSQFDVLKTCIKFCTFQTLVYYYFWNTNITLFNHWIRNNFQRKNKAKITNLKWSLSKYCPYIQTAISKFFPFKKSHIIYFNFSNTKKDENIFLFEYASTYLLIFLFNKQIMYLFWSQVLSFIAIFFRMGQQFLKKRFPIEEEKF